MVNKNIKIHMPKEVEIIISILNENNFEAFIVGGCVRDSLLEKKPLDWDITTNASPDNVMSVFKKQDYRVIETGIVHGTVTVVIKGQNFEITTYRIDGEYLDNRRPTSVTFTASLEQDLMRRDFTINAMAYNVEAGLIDYYGGTVDLENKIIRAVGDPNKRFQEDALRTLRAIRFATRLSFDIEEKTLFAIKLNSHLILNVSNERIRDELCKMIVSNDTAKGFKLLEETKLLGFILPELQVAVGFKQQNPHHDKDIFEHILAVVEKCPPEISLRVAGLLHDIAKPNCFTIDKEGIGHFYGHDKKSVIIAEQILRRLKFDNQSICKIKILVKEHMHILTKPTDASVKRLINRVGVNLVHDLFALQKADALGSRFPEIRLNEISKVEEKTLAILESKVPLSIKELAVNGGDLMCQFSIKQGEEIGGMLKFLLDKVLENPELNSKEKLIAIIYDEYIK